MPSRRQIREAVIQYLYSADQEMVGSAVESRDAFWEFITESAARTLHLARFKTLNHLAQGRDDRLVDFVKRHDAAISALAAWPEADVLKRDLQRLAELESRWSTAFAALQRLPRDGDDATVAANFSTGLEAVFLLERELAETRTRFIRGMEDFPKLKSFLEPVAGTLRKMLRFSDRVNMVAHPEDFPEQADLESLRQAQREITDLRAQGDELIQAVQTHRAKIDEQIAEVVENFAPERLDAVDRAILRLGSYEICSGKVPVKVAINEAIELAKRFGTSDSHRFVNGILDKIAQHFSATQLIGEK